jgi:uncharacterized protein (DUF924 family)
MSKVDEILEFWFGNSLETKDNKNKSVYFQELWDSIWFAGIKEKEVDLEIKTRFLNDLKNTLDGKYKEWEETALGSLALILILDQFNRNIFRGSPKSFEHDQEAKRICLDCIRKNFDKEVVPIGRVFMYLPLLHSEDINDQIQSIQLFQKLKEENKQIGVIFERFCTLAEKKKEEIEKYGRFPKRNKILGRKSTKQEDEDYFLQFQ